MPVLNEINAFMSEWAKPEFSEPWDNDGVMLCGDMLQNIDNITVCLEVNEKAVADACKNGSQLIITHHPFIFKPLKSLCGVEYRITSKLISAGISVFSYHTRLDTACGGVNDVLAQKLGLSGVTPFAEMGRYGALENGMTPQEFGEYIKKILGCGTMRCALPESLKNIKTVAVLGGGGKDFVDAAAEVADAYITSDLSHNAFITAKEKGICLYDAGHYYTENPVVYEIHRRLTERFEGITVNVSDSLCPYTLI